MKTTVHSIIWSVDAEIQRNGYGNNTLDRLSLFDRLALLGQIAKEAHQIGPCRWRSEALKERTQLMYPLQRIRSDTKAWFHQAQSGLQCFLTI